MNTTCHYTLLLTFLISILLNQAIAASDDVFCQKDKNTSNKTDNLIKDNKITQQKTTLTAINRGEQIHQNHCYKCHSEQIYTRKDRFIRSIKALSKQVKHCGKGSQVQWSNKDTDAIVEFLNQKYYKF